MPATSVRNDQKDGVIAADGHNLTPTLAIAAAGSNSQANAYQLLYHNSVVATVSATTRGLKLLANATGRQVWIGNATATAVKVYPQTNGKINASSTNASYQLAANTTALFWSVDATRWLVLKSA